MGVVYAFFFIMHAKRKIETSDATSDKKLARKQYRISLLITLLRIIILIVLWSYILRSPSIHFILVLVAFIAAFWYVIISMKAKTHERS